jgi:CheY-like chemotaxis protein
MSTRPRILVVDDEMGVRESLRAILQSDCEVVTASTGEEALDVVARAPVDIMTLDLKMPGLGGIGVLERAKQIDPDLEVVIITATARSTPRCRASACARVRLPLEALRQHARPAADPEALARRAAVRRMKTVPEQLLSSLSHELRTPLNVIMGYSTILQEEGFALRRAAARARPHPVELDEPPRLRRDDLLHGGARPGPQPLAPTPCA